MLKSCLGKARTHSIIDARNVHRYENNCNTEQPLRYQHCLISQSSRNPQQMQGANPNMAKAKRKTDQLGPKIDKQRIAMS